MATAPSLRLALTGTHELTLRCAQVALDAGHRIALFVSASETVLDWARQRGIASERSFDAVDPSSIEIDHLLSVINGVVLPRSILALPRGLAVNYHNGPLPRYAGVHAASWAVLNGATTHAMTWHAMSEEIDAGDILLQARFPIGERATAWDVNRTCHELAVATLPDLLARLARGAPSRRPQRLARRTYYSAAAKAPGGGLVRWSAPAESIDRLVRAHQVGPVVNTFGVAKVVLEGTAYALPSVEPLAERSSVGAGTLLACGPEAVRIATGTTDVRVPELVDMTGARHAAGPLLTRLGWRSGDRLPIPSLARAQRLRRALSDAARDERFCMEMLAAAAPSLPESPEDAKAGSAAVDLEVPPRLSPERLVASLLLLLRGPDGEAQTSVLVSTADQRHRAAGLEPFLASALPLTVRVTDDATPAELLEGVREQLAAIERRGVYARDAPMRRKLATVPRPGGLLEVEIAPGGDSVRLISTATAGARGHGATLLSELARAVLEGAAVRGSRGRPAPARAPRTAP